MTIALGTEIYNVDCSPVIARGAAYNEAELNDALAGSVSSILWDDQGTSNLTTLFMGLPETGFEVKRLKEILTSTPTLEAWRVGEGLAEAFLKEHRACEFPWPMGRDQRNPHANPAGADLVGFQKTGEESEPHRFAFGEVKTSGENSWPPRVMTGRSGLKHQLIELRDSDESKNALFRYLGHHASNAAWNTQYMSAAKRYLTDPTDVSIFGMLIRDVEPKPEDLKTHARMLSNGCPGSTQIELRAIYLPHGKIPLLVEEAKMAREGSYGNN